jgi:hypothetical protein
MAVDPRDKQRVELPIFEGQIIGTLSREEIYADDEADETTLWLAAQEQVLAKVWDNDEDAEYDD